MASWKKAATVFRELRVTYPTSSLNDGRAPVGNNGQAVTIPGRFTQRYATHPLAAGTNELRAELQRFRQILYHSGTRGETIVRLASLSHLSLYDALRPSALTSMDESGLPVL